MKNYIIKDTIINLETGETLIYYVGKDGYVWDEVSYPDGWSRKHFVEKAIKKEQSCPLFERIDDMNTIELKKWFHHYALIERED